MPKLDFTWHRYPWKITRDFDGTRHVVDWQGLPIAKRRPGNLSLEICDPLELTDLFGKAPIELWQNGAPPLDDPKRLARIMRLADKTGIGNEIRRRVAFNPRGVCHQGTHWARVMRGKK